VQPLHFLGAGLLCASLSVRSQGVCAHIKYEAQTHDVYCRCFYVTYIVQSGMALKGNVIRSGLLVYSANQVPFSLFF
jgi:hypothetical protein